jgi:hypothetical protein
MYSSDGAAWTVVTLSSTTSYWNDIAYGNGMFVAIGEDELSKLVATSNDGVSWATTTIDASFALQSITYVDNYFLVQGYCYLLATSCTFVSTDGVTWNESRSLLGLGDDFDGFYELLYNNGQLLALADDPSDSILLASYDATTSLAAASVSGLTVSLGSVLASMGDLSIAGDYTNNGTYTASTSEVTFGGTALQTATGTLSGTSAFYDLTVANTSQNGTTSQSVIWGAPLVVDGTYAMLASTSAQFVAGATSTLQNIDLYGTANSKVWLRSSSPGDYWHLDVPGSQLNVRYVDVKDSYASSTISANGSTDSGHNINWEFLEINTGSSTIANHDAGQAANTFTDQAITDGKLFAFKLVPNSGTATVTDMVITLSGNKKMAQTDFSNLRLFRDNDSDGVYDLTDTQVGGAGTMSLSAVSQTGTLTFATDFLSTTTTNYIVVGNWSAPANGSSLRFDLLRTGLSITDTSGTQDIYGSVVGSWFARNNRGGGGSASSDIGGAPPEGDGDQGGGGAGGAGDGQDAGEEIDSDPNFRAPSANSGSWTNGANAYDGVNGTYATDNAGATHSYTNHGFSVPGGNSIVGVAVKLELSGTTAAGTVGAQLSWNGGESWTTLKSSPTLTTSDAVITLGGPADTWGHSWSIGEFSNANFAVRLTGAPDQNTLRVDEIQVRVYHQASGGGGGGGGDI